MSRIAKKPIPIPSGVEVKMEGQEISVKGPKGQLEYTIHDILQVDSVNDELLISYKKEKPSSRLPHQLKSSTFTRAIAGTTRANINNMVVGVSQGYERKLLLNGVGYRAQLKGKVLGLSLGFSHPVDFPVPEGIVIESPIQTEIIIKGIDKQRVGQVAADIRAKRPVEPYKGKGIRYSDEKVSLKETKKK